VSLVAAALVAVLWAGGRPGGRLSLRRGSSSSGRPALSRASARPGLCRDRGSRESAISDRRRRAIRRHRSLDSTKPSPTGTVHTGARLQPPAGGNRYDYWRIAWSQSGTTAPSTASARALSIGPTARQRQDDGDSAQAHSIELQAPGDSRESFRRRLLLARVSCWPFSSDLEEVPSRPPGVWGGEAENRKSAGPRRRGSSSSGSPRPVVDWLHLIPASTGVAIEPARGSRLLRPGAPAPRSAPAALWPAAVWPGVLAGVSPCRGRRIVFHRPGPPSAERYPRLAQGASLRSAWSVWQMPKSRYRSIPTRCRAISRSAGPYARLDPNLPPGGRLREAIGLLSPTTTSAGRCSKRRSGEPGGGLDIRGDVRALSTGVETQPPRQPN